MSQFYAIHSQLYYNIDKEYQSIFTIDRNPPNSDPLNNIIKTIQSSNLSAFHNNTKSCILAILNPNNNFEFLNKTQLPLLFSFLSQNGYTIDTNLTKMLVDINRKNNLICIIHKN
tara:strand:+ start:206 stop:550 length:345 start_codon:yes stop_codon:yes gene_type:complete